MSMLYIIRKAFPLLLLFISVSVFSQEVHLNLPKNKNQKVSLSLIKGYKNDTIYKGKLDAEGKMVIRIPEKEKKFRGMVRLGLENQSVMDFIIANESPEIYSDAEYVSESNTVFSNSKENKYLKEWFIAQATNHEKKLLIEQLEPLYEKSTALSSALLEEQKKLETEAKALQKTLDASPLYAARFLKLFNFYNQEIPKLAILDAKVYADLRKQLRETLNLEDLYTSGFWYPVINGLTSLYQNESPLHSYFIEDMTHVLKRTKNEAVYTQLADNLFTICNARGWNDKEEALAYFLMNDGRLEKPTAKLQSLMNLFKIINGAKIPNLSQGELPKGKLLIVFYQNGCSSCDNEMEMLKANYKELKQKGYEVVSIAADIDEKEYQKTANIFPWKNKYCDFKGFAGPDFENYGVIGTPTFYVVNEEGIVQGRYARLQDTGLL